MTLNFCLRRLALMRIATVDLDGLGEEGDLRQARPGGRRPRSTPSTRTPCSSRFVACSSKYVHRYRTCVRCAAVARLQREHDAHRYLGITQQLCVVHAAVRVSETLHARTTCLPFAVTPQACFHATLSATPHVLCLPTVKTMICTWVHCTVPAFLGIRQML